jgi:mannose-6-phosphate isomerase-like protein (cupin superfamily)
MTFANGAINYRDRIESAAQIEWTQHPKFKGVYLKHLITGSDTEGHLSCHLVKVDPGCALLDHIHDPQWELHEVVEGEGVCMLDQREVRYYPGQMALIPQGTHHQVVASEKGLILLAKFFPALA